MTAATWLSRLVVGMLVLSLVGPVGPVAADPIAEDYQMRLAGESAHSHASAVCSGLASGTPSVVAVVPGTKQVLNDDAWVYPGSELTLIRCEADGPGNLTAEAVPPGLEPIERTNEGLQVVRVTAEATGTINLSSTGKIDRTLRVRAAVHYRSGLPGVETVLFPPDSQVSRSTYREREGAFLAVISELDDIADDQINRSAETLNSPTGPSSRSRLQEVTTLPPNVTKRVSELGERRRALEAVLFKGAWETRRPSGLAAINTVRDLDSRTRANVRDEIRRFNDALRSARLRARTTLLVDFLSGLLGAGAVGLGLGWFLMRRGADAVRMDQRRTSNVELGYETLWYRRRGGYLPKAVVILVTVLALVCVLLGAVVLAMRGPLLLLVGGL